ncbi:MAG: LPS export ABC transporter permease LptG [Magnetococcales bacterium]|nr:LPS export ABC transporter permease LptG [Magnetococcales bacterium]
MPMPILFGYLLRDFLIAFSKTVWLFIGLFLLIDGIEGIRRFSQKPNFHLMDFMLLILSRIPNFLGMLIPAMVLLTTLMAMARLVRQNEITVMRASGVSLSGILLPWLAGGVIIALFHALLIGQIAPRTNQFARDFRDHLLDQQLAPAVKSEDFWLRDGARIIHASRVELQTATLREVTVFTFTTDHRLAARLEARTARHSEAGWRLLDGIDYRFLPEPEVRPFQERAWELALDPQRLSAEAPLPDMLTVFELQAIARQLEQEGYDALRYQVLLHRRFAAPVSVLIAILLAFPFALRLPRSGGALRSTLLGLLLGFALFVFGDLMAALGMGGRLPALLAAWAPNLFFGGIAGFLLFHLDSPRRTHGT